MCERQSCRHCSCFRCACRSIILLCLPRLQKFCVSQRVIKSMRKICWEHVASPNVSRHLLQHHSCSCEAMERDFKLQKLDFMRRRVPHDSASALLREASRHGSMNLLQRIHIRETIEKHLAQHNRYGPLLKTLNLAGGKGCNVPVVVVNTLALIAGAYHRGGGFTNLVNETLSSIPSTKEKCWNFLLYADEIVPWNTLSPNNLRKSTVCYISL